MKNQLLLVSLLLIVSLAQISCGNDDDSSPSYDFADQNLQGTIDGLSFVYGEGTFETSPFTEGEVSIDLYHSDQEFTDVCDFFGFGDHVKIFFDIPSATGLYELSFDLSADSRTVTLFNPENSQNNIASMGAVEILTITNSELTGRMDARMDSENSVNGNFKVVLCPEN